MEFGQEEMKSLGVFGICRESYNIILSWRKIFARIILAYILPLSLISLANTHLLSNPPFPVIVDNNKTQITNIFDLLSWPSASQWLLLQLTYTIFSFIFSLLSTSAVVYTMACVYSGREQVTFTAVTRVVPKVLKRLMITSLSIFLVLSTYHIVAFLVFGLVEAAIAYGPAGANVGISILFVAVVLYLTGLLYMAVVWQLACTVSVLEESYGFRAMKRSYQLIKGKMGVSIIIFLKLGLLNYLLRKALERMVMNGDDESDSVSAVNRLAYASVCLSLILLLSLFEQVVQTNIYFVCKSYHHENVDKLDLWDHLLVYSLERCVSLKGENLYELKQLCLAVFLCIHMISKVLIVCLSRLLFLRICVKSRFSL